MGLSRASKGENPFGYASRIIPLYKELLARCAELDDTLYIQMEEPYLVKNPTAEVLALLKAAYQDLASVSSNIRIIVTSYFEHSNETTKILAETPIWGLGLDFVHGPQNIQGLKYAKGKKFLPVLSTDAIFGGMILVPLFFSLRKSQIWSVGNRSLFPRVVLFSMFLIRFRMSLKVILSSILLSAVRRSKSWLCSVESFGVR